MKQQNLRIVHIADKAAIVRHQTAIELGEYLLDKWNREADAKWEKKKQFLAKKKRQR